jgi:hypothetical protein
VQGSGLLIFFQTTNETSFEVADQNAELVRARVITFQAADGLAGQRTVEGKAQAQAGQTFGSKAGRFRGTDRFDQIGRSTDFLCRCGENVTVDLGLPGMRDG